MHSPIHSVPDLEWEAAIAVSRERGLLSTYQELVLWAEAFQRQQVLGHAARNLAAVHPGPVPDTPASVASPAATPVAPAGTNAPQVAQPCGKPPGEGGSGCMTKVPSLEAARATVRARMKLEAAMRSGRAPDGSTRHQRLQQAAQLPLRPDEASVPVNMHVDSQVRAHLDPVQPGPCEPLGEGCCKTRVCWKHRFHAYESLCQGKDQWSDLRRVPVLQRMSATEAARVVDVLGDHADRLLTAELHHMHHVADVAGTPFGRLPTPDDRAAAGVGERWSDAESDDGSVDGHEAHDTPSAHNPVCVETACVLGAADGDRHGDVGNVRDRTTSDGHTDAAQENVPPAEEVRGNSEKHMAELAKRVKKSCIADASPNALLVERGSAATLAALCDTPSIVMESPCPASRTYSGAAPASRWQQGSAAEAAVEQIRGMVEMQPAAAGCALRQPPPQLVRTAGVRARGLPCGSADVQHAWCGRGSAYTFRRRRPVLAHLSSQQALHAHAILQRSAPPVRALSGI